MRRNAKYKSILSLTDNEYLEWLKGEAIASPHKKGDRGAGNSAGGRKARRRT